MAVDRRVAENQDRFRRANEDIDRARADLGFDGDRVPYLCECPDERCVAVIPLTGAEYSAVRTSDDRYFVIPGHEDPGEEVVDRRDGFLIVEKGAVV